VGLNRPVEVKALSAACGKELPFELVPRRPGDVAVTDADPARALEVLGWKASLGLEAMCADGWRWQQQNPDGYGR
jgi:UDP-glucose 4-epimerase